MSINKKHDIQKFDDANIPIMQQILDDIIEQSEGTIFTDTLPTTTTVPVGKKVVYDDGAGTKRIYYKTGKGNLGYISLT